MIKVENFLSKLLSIDFFEITSCFKVAVYFFALFFTLVSTSPVSALGWDDKEWVEAGCPLNIFGMWVSNGSDTDSENLLNIYQDKIVFLNNSGLEEKYSYDQNNILMNKSYIGVNLQPDSKEKSTYLNLRPYLVRPESMTMQVNKITQNCFVKVFKFESKKNAKYGKYLNWEIYKLKNKQ
jgi:hypothetical protein